MDISKKFIIRNLACDLAQIINLYTGTKEEKQRLIQAEHRLINECQEWDSEKYIILDRGELIEKMADLVIKACEFGLQGQPFYVKEQKEAVKDKIKKIIEEEE